MVKILRAAKKWDKTKVGLRPVKSIRGPMTKGKKIRIPYKNNVKFTLIPIISLVSSIGIP